MKKLNPALFLTASDLMVNLAAGWFGAAFILPAFSSGVTNIHSELLIVDVLFGTLCFVIAYQLRKGKSGYGFRRH